MNYIYFLFYSILLHIFSNYNGRINVIRIAGYWIYICIELQRKTNDTNKNFIHVVCVNSAKNLYFCFWHLQAFFASKSVRKLTLGIKYNFWNDVSIWEIFCLLITSWKINGLIFLFSKRLLLCSFVAYL